MKLLKVALAFVAGAMAPMVWAEDVAPSIDGTVYTFDISGDGTYSAAIPGTCTKVVKKGAGYLKMSGHSVDFHGAVEIQAGTVEAQDAYALGCGTAWHSPNTISVWSGAQLRATFSGDKDDGNAEGRGFRSRLRLAGDGLAGINDGAFYYDNDAPAIAPRWMAYEVVLDDDASVGGLSKYSFYRINLNGKHLTYDNDADGFDFYYCGDIHGSDAEGNPGTFEVKKSVYIWSSPWTGTRADVFKPAGSAIFFYTAKPIPFSVDWDVPGQGTFELKSGGADGTANVFNGDFTFRGTQLLSWPVADVAVTMNGSFYAPYGFLNKGGAGQMFMNGPTNLIAKYVNMSQGDLFFKNGLTNEFTYFQQQGTSAMRLRFEDANDIVLTSDSASPMRGRYTSNASAIARFELLGRSRLIGANEKALICVGQGTSFTAGTTERCAGKAVFGDGTSAHLNLSIGVNGRGAVYATNCTLCWNSQSTAFPGTVGGGVAGYGYYGMTGGSTTIPHQLFIAGNNNDTSGFFVQRGGETTLKNEFLGVSLRGHANIYVGNGGQFVQEAGSGYMGYTDGAMGTGGDGTVTVEGAGSLFKQYWFVTMGKREDFTSYVNVNDGGTLECTYAVCNQTTWPAGSELYMSFNGGTWKSTAGLHNIFNLKDETHVPKFLCQKKGLTIDTGTGTCHVNVPITRPTGKVIKSITLPTDATFLAHPYFGPARITIESTGAGAGATAFAPFDDANECLDGTVKITSPGTSYDAETTVVKVWSMESDQSWNCTFELEDAQDGGVTKLGTGKLAYVVPNTYTGLTYVAEGQLSLACANAIGDRQGVKIGADGLLVAEADFTFATLGGAGTLQVNSGMQVTVADSFMVDGDLLAAGNKMNVTGSGTFTFATGAKIRPYDAAKFVSAAGPILTAKQINGTPELEGFPDNYALKLNDARTELKLRVKKGLVLLLN